MIKSLTLFLVLAAAIINTSYANTTIETTTSESNGNSIKVAYSSPVRLQQIINDSLHIVDRTIPSKDQDSSSPKNIYWLSAGLYDQSTYNDFKIKKSSILEDLKTKYSDKLENINSLNSLYSWVADQIFLRRISIPLDYDLIRIREELNPMVSGKYLLKLPTKPDYVTVLGAVERNGRQPYSVKQNAAEYIEQAQAIHDSDDSFAWLIQPDGHVEQYPIAYYSQRHIEIAPGAIIYLEFKGARDNEAALNNNMLDLLKNWIH